MIVFSASSLRPDPYKTYRFLILFGTSTLPVAGFSKMTTLMHSRDVVRKGLGRTKYEPITLELGVTHDPDFLSWAEATRKIHRDVPRMAFANVKREVRIREVNEVGAPIHGHIVHRCWVSEFQGLPDLDGSANGIAIEHIKLENQGWEIDATILEA